LRIVEDTPGGHGYSSPELRDGVDQEGQTQQAENDEHAITLVPLKCEK
jgi:hypothetical protein